MDLLRQIVSGKKKRYLEDGYNLDLTYITPRIIAMSLPGEGVHKMYRNSIDSVAKFLAEKHRSKFKILNLSGLKYNYEKFGNHVNEYYWEDHYPPTIELLFTACRDIHEWLIQDPENIIAVNCKAGKGRTGTLICCYLLFCGKLTDPNQAMKYYKAKRFSKGGGVTQPSQIRYTIYFSDILTGKIRLPLIVSLNRVQLFTAPHVSGNSSKLIFEIKANDRIVYSNKALSRDKQQSFTDSWEETATHELALIESELFLQGDITCLIAHWGLIRLKKICRFSFNTAFISESEVLRFEKRELDPDNFKNSRIVSENFYVYLDFQKKCTCNASMDISERCRFCIESLSRSEIDKWQMIRDIVLKKIDMDPVVCLFGNPELDDVYDVLTKSVEESELSSDGSAD
ncbi:hypothetical protein SteCoe_17251 [Stentor coeruleus]|uniref:Phosphatidylinositol-3,4,5-trisphosphate 3-phosphatase n=1 Tax=Stentor coeruleus TaxID=5963 RepID=A0A1R2BZB3_9CILI|nr:hypothetical protein SteCoe_17251 [Stentor coeruleus]